MFSIWWPAYVFPCIIVLCGLAWRLLPGRKYRSPLGPLTKERQEFADRLLLKFRDIADVDKRFFPSLRAVYDKPGGFPEASEEIAGLYSKSPCFKNSVAASMSLYITLSCPLKGTMLRNSFRNSSR